MTEFSRRTVLSALAAIGAGAALPRHGFAETVDPRPGVALGEEATPFSREWLLDEARRRAGENHGQRGMIPQAWRDMTYEQYRAFWFNSERALWQGTDRPVRLDFFHPGLYFPRPVGISVVQEGMARPVAFDLDLFKQGEQAPELPIDDTLGYSGLRIRGAVGDPGEYKEFAVFQGASYFRGIAREQNYGLSARGLALRTGDPRGEEFPEFTDFWIEEPAPGDNATIVHALLDSPSVTGAYRFAVTPGDTTVMNVQATIFPREALDNAGIAPLTSMFLFDETNRNRFDDFRPAVHDSEGLLVHNGAGEVLWRPLANPVSLQISQFLDDNPQGFGLMQRARGFSDYADLEAHYHTRPSLWIEPGEGWGKGAVTLVEIPADREIYDNIVAYWRPREDIPAGEGHSFSYRMAWGGEPDTGKSVARVINTRIGKAFGDGKVVAIDFENHDAIPEDLSELDLRIGSSAGEVTPGIVQRNPDTGGPRLAFTLKPGEAQSIELRARMLHQGRTVTEIWLYRWTV